MNNSEQVKDVFEKCLRHAFPISLHLVLALNVRKVFALISLHFVQTLNVGKVFAPLFLFPYISCRSET